MNSKSVYTEEFKQGAVSLVLDQGLSQSEVSRRLGTSSKNINRWVKQSQQGQLKGISNAPSQDWMAKAKQLEKDNKQLRMERDILKKAAVDSVYPSTSQRMAGYDDVSCITS